MVFFHPFNSNNQARHSFKAQKCVGSRGERSSLPLYSCLRSSNFPALGGFPIKIASSRGPNLVKSFDMLTTLAKDSTLESAQGVAGIWFGWKSRFSEPLCYFP
ncbi:hypothetical protein AVEN_221573-1 [Araneus ventricosus]|uniref:Uncharacterized protein n=1 Tax=Araneus ventricosus TaxID=182803 RepID=A0A4Y2FB14_ARAVE|nr:hypothetical protein AVEN_221573-1 [Araneus ventricosus]